MISIPGVQIIIIITIIIIFIIIIKVLPSSTPVFPISQQLLEILTQNFQDAFKFPKNTLSFILTLMVIIIIVFIVHQHHQSVSLPPPCISANNRDIATKLS